MEEREIWVRTGRTSKGRESEGDDAGGVRNGRAGVAHDTLVSGQRVFVIIDFETDGARETRLGFEEAGGAETAVAAAVTDLLVIN